MSAPQFTPGPWHLHFNTATAEPTRALGGKFKPRGHKTTNDYLLRVEVTGENVRADTALIESAPELYEALENLVGLARADSVSPTYCDDADAALAKARGDQ